MDSCQADREVLGFGKFCGKRQLTLTDEGQYLCGSNLEQAIAEVMLACRLSRLNQLCSSARDIPPYKLQAGENHFRGSDSISGLDQPRHFEALASILFCRIEVIP